MNVPSQHFAARRRGARRGLYCTLARKAYRHEWCILGLAPCRENVTLFELSSQIAIDVARAYKQEPNDVDFLARLARAAHAGVVIRVRIYKPSGGG